MVMAAAESLGLKCEVVPVVKPGYHYPKDWPTEDLLGGSTKKLRFTMDSEAKDPENDDFSERLAYLFDADEVRPYDGEERPKRRCIIWCNSDFWFHHPGLTYVTYGNKMAR